VKNAMRDLKRKNIYVSIKPEHIHIRPYSLVLSLVILTILGSNCFLKRFAKSVV
jgi:hypothetical protein